MQLKKIHTLKNAIGMEDDQYRSLVQEIHGFSLTSKDLSIEEADLLIARLEAIAIPMGVWQKYAGRKKYEDLGRRRGFATSRQLRFIEYLWKMVSFTHKEYERQRALRRFIFKIAGVDEMRFLEQQHAVKVIEALQQMRKSHPTRRNGDTEKRRCKEKEVAESPDPPVSDSGALRRDGAMRGGYYKL